MCVRLSFRMEQLRSHWTDLHEIWYLYIFRSSVEKIRDKGTLQEDQLTFSVVSRSALLRMRNVSDRPCKETQNTHCMINNFFLAQILPFCDMMWRKNPVEPDSPQMTIWRMRILR
jgi:hypothetical protein